MRSKLLWLAAPLVLSLGLLAGTLPMMASASPPSAPPGQGPCSHGNTGKECRPDPSTNGKDCDPHGNQGGVNEDHCVGSTPTTTEDTPPVTTTDGQTTTTVVTDTTPAITPATTTDGQTITTVVAEATPAITPVTTTDTQTPTTVVAEATPAIKAADTPNVVTAPATSTPDAAAGQQQATSNGVAGVKVSKARAAKKTGHSKTVQKSKKQPKRHQVLAAKRHLNKAPKHPQVNPTSIKRVHALPFTL